MFLAADNDVTPWRVQEGPLPIPTRSVSQRVVGAVLWISAATATTEEAFRTGPAAPDFSGIVLPAALRLPSHTSGGDWAAATVGSETGRIMLATPDGAGRGVEVMRMGGMAVRPLGRLISSPPSLPTLPAPPSLQVMWCTCRRRQPGCEDTSAHLNGFTVQPDVWIALPPACPGGTDRPTAARPLPAPWALDARQPAIRAGSPAC